MEQTDRERLAAKLADRTPKGLKIVHIHLGNICNPKCNFCWYHSPLVTYNEKVEYTSYPVIHSVIDAAFKKYHNILETQP